MRSRVVTGSLVHSRKEPVGHSFTYPFYSYCLDLDELPELSAALPLFGYNKPGAFSIFDADYLGSGPGSIKEKALLRLKEAGVGDIARIELVTTPRYFNYAFNPVSFYFCYRADGEIAAHLAEINNTYGERHVYVFGGSAAPNLGAPHGLAARYRVKKEFFVSPFNPVEGEYDVCFGDLREKLDVRFNILKAEETVFVSRMSGALRPLSTGSQLRLLIGFPLSALLTMPRIVWQAQKLRFLKALPMLWKPAPRSARTEDVKASRRRRAEESRST